MFGNAFPTETLNWICSKSYHMHVLYDALLSLIMLFFKCIVIGCSGMVMVSINANVVLKYHFYAFNASINHICLSLPLNEM